MNTLQDWMLCTKRNASKPKSSTGNRICGNINELNIIDLFKECSVGCTLFCTMEIAVAPYDSIEYHEMLALRYKILRAPWGLCFSEEDLQQEKDDIFIVCREKGCIIGCCILTGLTPSTVKLRQMAVSSQWQGKNVGTNILEFAEQYAAGRGYAIIRLHARKTASTFYIKCGYIIAGTEFLEIGMPHVLMEKLIR